MEQKSLLTALEKDGVEIVFGLPGGANLPIYDALVDSKLRHILVRHEQSARIWLTDMQGLKGKSVSALLLPALARRI